MAINLATRVVRKTSDSFTLDADVCVVGSGAAGSMAALTAASLGQKVVLLEAMPAVGGQLVGALLGTICGLYSNGPKPHRQTYGPVDAMLRDLHREGAIQPRRALDTIVLHYDEARCGRWVEHALIESGTTVVPGAVLRGVQMEGRRIVALDVATRWGDLTVRTAGVVDASGDATVAWHAGLAVHEPETAQWGTQMIVIDGFDQDNVADFDGFKVEEALRRRRHELGLVREDGFVFAFPGRGVATVNLTHVPTPTEPVGAARAAIEGRDQADKILALLREEFPRSLGQAQIRAYGQTGIRQTRWFVGAHQLTLDEVRAGVRPPDAVARCSWPVEAHDSAERVAWEQFAGPDHVHYVPFASMVHRDADNLVAAGRCIDGDTAALASVRVMGPCFAMGQAAAHALDIVQHGSLHEINIAELQSRVRDNLETEQTDGWCDGI